MSVVRLRLTPVGETMFPPRAPFFFQGRFGSAEDPSRGNLPVPPEPPPQAHRPGAGR
jgi:hypothetical protein